MALSRNKWKRILISAITALAFIAVFLVVDQYEKTRNIKTQICDDFVKVIDVGQGDSILIASNGYYALLDTGTAEAGNEVCGVLSDLGIRRLDLLLFSHMHDDHTGGAEKLLTGFEVENLILPELSIEDEGLSDGELALHAVTEKKGKVSTAKQGMNCRIGDFTLTILTDYFDEKDENDRSLMVMAEMDGKRFLFTGDAGTKAENRLMEEGIDPDCDVLKVGHHGSSGSTGDAFLRAASPAYAAVSVGEGNSYGHPSDRVIKLLENQKVTAFRTDIAGDITFYIDGGKIIPQTER